MGNVSWSWLAVTVASLLAGSSFAFAPMTAPQVVSSTFSSSSTRLFYDIQRNSRDENVWSVLATTERWISNTLQDAAEGNPLSRKEVSYVCETSTDAAMIVANIFRKLKEARKLGERHSHEQEDHIDQAGGDPAAADRSTLRQTQVMVIPSSPELTEFPVFDKLLGAINQARRNARDYVTDLSLEKLDERMHGDGDRDWSVSVNCAHLHPNFGEKTPEEQLKELEEEPEEIDLNLQAYKERRLLARRSPYPSVVVEVRATPPADFSPPPPSGPVSPKTIKDEEKVPSEEKISSDFVQELEALFGKSSLQGKETSKDGFYESIGSHIEEISSVTPLSVAQTWISQNDPLFDMTSSAFTVSDGSSHVDEAYEFVFTNLAMQTCSFLSSDSDSSVDSGAQKRMYLVLPNFVTSSATSLEKFSNEVMTMIQTLPPLRNKVDVSTFHPEHIHEAKRSPLPILVLHWKE